MIRAGIIGAAGFTGGELIRILSNHPEVEIDFCQSNSQAGKLISEVHPGCMDLDLTFVSEITDDVDALFFCMGHGRSKSLMNERSFRKDVAIIDLSHDFRIKGEHGFIYGLPEVQRDEIRGSKRIANPGCFATTIELGLLPLAAGKYIQSPVHVHAITGSTGAGQALSRTTHFTWRSNNISVYKAFNHQHLGEIKQTLSALDENYNQPVHFVPMRGDFTRGILASIYMETNEREQDLVDRFKAFYKNHPFVKVSNESVDLKMVVNTNYCILNVQVYDGMVHIVSAIDNLIKGASGQAVQNMNLIFGFAENAGLNLKSSVF